VKPNLVQFQASQRHPNKDNADKYTQPKLPTSQIRISSISFTRPSLAVLTAPINQPRS
jgi:hypothetical protein